MLRRWAERQREEGPRTPRRSLADDVLGFVESDQLDRAIALLRGELGAADGSVSIDDSAATPAATSTADSLEDVGDRGHPSARDDAALLARALAELERDVRQGAVSREDATVRRQRIARQVLAMLRELERSRDRTSGGRSFAGIRRPPDRRETRARAGYLAALRTHVERLLETSLQRVRFIDLGVKNAPHTTQLPRVHPSTPSDVPLESVGQAMEHFDGRLLILGHPGAGKTTVLLDLVLTAIASAEQDATAPVPLLVNLSAFQSWTAPGRARWISFMGPAARDTGERDSAEHIEDRRLERWLGSELASWPGGVRAELAERWIAEDRVAFFLDGLDEVGDERRAELVRLLNRTLLWRHQDAVAVVCSRVNEYRPLAEQASTRLWLDGAIELQPFSREQIDRYLTEAQVPALRAAIAADPTLLELAETPLMLSMMTLAFAGLSTEQILASPAHSALADQRHRVMEAYVERMVQRKERRDRDRPFDDDRRHDVPVQEYRFTPEQIGRYLGWLAVRMSVRMRTTCSQHRMFEFLRQGLAEQHQKGDRLVVGTVTAVIVTAGLLLVAAPIVPWTWWWVGIVVAGSAVTGIALGLDSLHEWTRSDDEPLDQSLGILGAALVVFGVGVVAQVVALSESLNISPYAAGFLLLAGSVLALVAVSAIRQSRGRVDHSIAFSLRAALICWLLAVVAAAVTSWCLPQVTLGWRPTSVIVATLASAQVGFVAVSVWRRDRDWRNGLLLLLLALGVSMVLAAAIWLAGDLAWPRPWIAALLTAAVVVHFRGAAGHRWLLGGALIAACGGWWFGGAGSLMGMTALVALLGLLQAVAERESPIGRASDRIRRATSEWTDRRIERFVRTPLIGLQLSLGRRLPARLREFLRFSESALLLKPSPDEIEFIHRRLRDYFALRGLVPLLNASDPSTRLEAIKAMGFQGVSSIETLGDVLRDGDTQSAVAAVAGLGRISAPETTAHLAWAFERREPEVRAAVMANLRNFEREDGGRIILAGLRDSARDVGIAAIDAALDGIEGPGWSDVIYAAATEGLMRVEHLRRIAQRLGSWTEPGDDSEYRALRGSQFLSATSPSEIRSLLQDGEWAVRRWAVALLGRGEVHVAAGEIAERLRVDPHADVRLAAARAFRRLAGPVAEPELIRALQDQDPSVRETVLELFGESADDGGTDAALAVADLLGDRVPRVRRAAIRALARRDPRLARERVVSMVDDADRDVRAAAIEGLARVRTEQVAPIVQALGDDAVIVRRAAIAALEGLRAEGSAVDIARCLRDRDDEVRMAAAKAVGVLGHREAIPALSRALGDRSAGVRAASADALGILGPTAALRPLLNACRDRSPDVRSSAAHALSRCDATRVFDALAALCSDRVIEVRAAAYRSLGALGDLRAAPLLRSAFTEVGDVEGLERSIGMESSLQEMLDSIVRASAALGGDSAIELLTIAAQHPVPRVRATTASALSELRVPAAAALLHRLQHDPDREVAAAAVEALRQRGEGASLLALAVIRGIDASQWPDDVRAWVAAQPPSTVLPLIVSRLVERLDLAEVGSMTSSISLRWLVRPPRNPVPSDALREIQALAQLLVAAGLDAVQPLEDAKGRTPPPIVEHIEELIDEIRRQVRRAP